MKKRRELWYGLMAMMIGLSGACMIGEVVLRFLPVARNPLVVPVTPSDPVFHYAPNRSYSYSRGWNLHSVNQGRVNNAGMVNDQDYQRANSSPVLAVIGDSYIEALMVPYAETLQGRLAKALEGRMQVYSFGASGAPLSQYLIWGRLAVREYGAKKVIINIVDNDFDESHDLFKRYFPGFWIYVPAADGQLRLQLYPFHQGIVRSLVKHSALARYLFVNLQLRHTLSRQGPLFSAGAGNAGVDSREVRVAASLAATDAFFRDLPEYIGLPPEDVLFILDGRFRYAADSAKGVGSYFDLMRRAFRERAEARDYQVIDAEPFFLEASRQRALRFEGFQDRHWNGTAHGVVAEAALRSRLLGPVTLATKK